ncbi:MAG: DUF5131 family protein [Methylobacterium sp.]|nr:DUF5131 family protein [Methylobacterium sp.]
MAENSGIAWTDHTFNPWVGCTKVGPGCDACYAETWNARFGAGVAPNWGPGAPRRRTTPQNWNKVRKWQREARETGRRIRVFCASLADVFDNEVPAQWRADLWSLTLDCPDLDWILVTKRVGNVAKMVSPDWKSRPVAGLPSNVILLATIVNQEEADRDMDKLKALKHVGVVSKIGVSYEPALGPVDWSQWIDAIDWLIVGGESDQGKNKARPFEVLWARDAIKQARRTGCAVFIKQLGSNPVFGTASTRGQYADKAGANPDEWPVDVNVRKFPVIGSNIGCGND